jgi:Rrf2 family protein
VAVIAADPGNTASPVWAFTLPLRVPARVDYAIRALIEMAASDGGLITVQRISRAQAIPPKFLRHILAELKRTGLLRSHRGPGAGYALARSPQDITLEDILRAIEGGLSTVHGTSLDEISYPGAAKPLRDVWLALRSSLSVVLASVTLADLAQGNLPPAVQALAGQPYPPAKALPLSPRQRWAGKRPGSRS